jgi:hypothetical protein
MKRSLRAIAVTAALIATTLLPAPASAATLVVDDDGVQCPGASYTTIQDAVNAAGTGDTIQVCEGTYPEPAAGPLTINEDVTVEGAQAGVDARGPRGLESVITDSQGTSVTVSGVVIDGFTVQNSTNPFVNGGFGILMSPPTSGTQILNNIIQNNIIGIGLGGSNVTIRHNLIRNNTMPGPASGSGIYTDQFVGGASVSDVLVQENAFSGHAGFGGAINISNTAAGGGVFRLDVDSNSFDMNSRAFVLFNTHDSTIHDNTSTNSTFVMSADVRIFDNNTNLSILNNDFSMGVGHAIRTSFLGLVGGPSSGLEIHQNNIEVFALTGLTVDPLSHSGTVDAECNWWNSPSGPTDPVGNPGGTGEEVVGDADYTPWLTAPAPGGACIGGVPSTPGKVTGGGQVEGDPLFSPLGELISLPALIVSLNGGSQANFGFVIQFASGASAPKGNLVYDDHDAGVHIKATSFDQLVIEAGICGSNTHASFTGMAKVNGASESLTVEVDDCGEPSSPPPPDTFSIKTDTYSNSGPLIGGNIQIH